MASNFKQNLKNTFKLIYSNRFDRSLMKYFDWPLFLTVIAITLFGIVCIFSATTSNVTEVPNSFVEMIQTQSTLYPGNQLLWLLLSLLVMGVVIFFPFQLYERYADAIYWTFNGLLLLTLFVAKVGRGGMTAFLSWGDDHGFQTSELAKVSMVLSYAKVFSKRTRPMRQWGDVFRTVAYAIIPVLLIVLQPDVGTALVYIATLCVLIVASGTDRKMIWTVLGTCLILVIPVWYMITNSNSDNFRFTRILIWLNPEAYPDDARQVINAQIAIGSGGWFGKGIVSPGSFASLGYISDDHTDFIFSIVCESFGAVGGIALISAYMFFLFRMIRLAAQTEDKFGSFLITGVMGMFLFHVVENIGMVIGLLPVTGIPLPFVSYGGSNLMTNMACVGLVLNVVMRTRASAAVHKETIHKAYAL